MDANKLGDTYLNDSDDDEGQQAMDDIDAFERRLRGEAPAAAQPSLKTSSSVNKPKQQEQQRKPKPGAHYVQAAHAAVKTAAVSEKAADAAEGRRMVSELDDFDSRR